MSPWLRKRDGSVVWAVRMPDGSWCEYPPDFKPNIQPYPTMVRCDFSSRLNRASGVPDALRQFLREIGRRGRLERSRNHARRTVRGWIRFNRRYQCDPGSVSAQAVNASPDVRQWLSELARRGGRARARKYSREQLRAWSAKGGHAKAAKAKNNSLPGQGVAGKQEVGRPGRSRSKRVE